ncbi:thymidine kinase [Allokutzneria multivorans]|uniref:Thymidine kinase n=1 Tax=Allokutzneria multivorans TaxID=1142134 RepID=A0ABP7T547_9PSEU
MSAPVTQTGHTPAVDATHALSPVPSAAARRDQPVPGRIRYYFGPMACGKSTLALQIDHNHARQGRRGLLLVRHDRSGTPTISSRIGITRDAIEVHEEMNIQDLVRAQWAGNQRVDYLIVDEAQFLSPCQVEQLAELADHAQVDVYCFGLAIDFRSHLFPGTQRLVELADELHPVQVEVLCWCGLPGKFNARTQDNRILREGDTVLVADTADSDPGAESTVRYQVLCRRHYRSGELGPQAVPAGQLSLA